MGKSQVRGEPARRRLARALTLAVLVMAAATLSCQSRVRYPKYRLPSGREIEVRGCDVLRSDRAGQPRPRSHVMEWRLKYRTLVSDPWDQVAEAALVARELEGRAARAGVGELSIVWEYDETRITWFGWWPHPPYTVSDRGSWTHRCEDGAWREFRRCRLAEPDMARISHLGDASPDDPARILCGEWQDAMFGTSAPTRPSP